MKTESTKINVGNDVKGKRFNSCITNLQKGNEYNKPYKILDKKTPFARILANINKYTLI